VPDASNTDLPDKAKRGDQSALAELLRLHQHRLYHVVLRMVGPRDDAAEVTQEAMLKIIEHIGDFQGRSDIKTWMTRIAMNLSFSFLRKRRLRQTISLDTKGHAGTTGGLGNDQLTPLRHQLAHSSEPHPQLRIQQTEELDHLHSALGRLQDDLRVVLVLRDIDQMDYPQIAEVVAIPVGTVKSRLFRARLALRKELSKTHSAHDTTGTQSGNHAQRAVK